MMESIFQNFSVKDENREIIHFSITQVIEYTAF